MKFCRKCGTNKLIEEFYIWEHKTSSQCKVCIRAQSKEDYHRRRIKSVEVQLEAIKRMRKCRRGLAALALYEKGTIDKTGFFDILRNVKF